MWKDTTTAVDKMEILMKEAFDMLEEYDPHACNCTGNPTKDEIQATLGRAIDILDKEYCSIDVGALQDAIDENRGMLVDCMNVIMNMTTLMIEYPNITAITELRERANTMMDSLNRNWQELYNYLCPKCGCPIKEKYAICASCEGSRKSPDNNPFIIGKIMSGRDPHK